MHRVGVIVDAGGRGALAAVGVAKRSVASVRTKEEAQRVDEVCAHTSVGAWRALLESGLYSGEHIGVRMWRQLKKL